MEHARPGRVLVLAAPLARRGEQALVLVPLAGAGWLVFHAGGYTVDEWGPWGIVTLLLFAVVLAARPLERRRAALPGALAALALLALLSAAWAPAPASALVEGGRFGFYAATAGLAALALGGRGGRRFAAGAVAALSGACALVLATRLAAGDDAQELFLLGRLAGSIGYAGGLAAALAVGFWPLVATACGRGALVPRLAAGAGAGAVAALLVPTEARAPAAALALAGVAFLLLAPRRAAAIWLVALCGAAVALRLDDLTAAFAHGAGDAQARAVGAAALFAAGAGALGAAALASVERLGLAQRVGRPVRLPRAVLALGAAAVVLGAAAGALRAVDGHPLGALSSEWQQFRRGPNPSGDTRFASLGGGRYDLWRVGLRTFHAHPLLGTGAGGFAAAYQRDGRSQAQPRQAHSEPLEVAATLGLPGLFLLVAAAALVGRGALAARFAAGSEERLASAAAAAGVLAFATQALVDWTWHLAADALPALVLAGALVTAPGAAGPALQRPARLTAAVLAGLLAVALVAPATLAQRYLLRSYGEEGAAALRDADRAAAFDPISARPALARARALLAEGRGAAALAAARTATRAEPELWVTWQLRSLAAARLGRTEEAAAASARARAENPHVPLAFRAGLPPAAYDTY